MSLLRRQLSRGVGGRNVERGLPRPMINAPIRPFGAICPARGVSAGLVLPFCNSVAMNLHLAEISANVSPGAYAILILDQAGWYHSNTLEVPDNITILPLPPKSPELNPVENI